MQILKKTGINWRERRLISKLYLGWNVKVKLDQERAKIVKTGKEVRQGFCLSPIVFNLYSEYFTKKALEEFEELKTGIQVICAMKYADGLVLMAKEERGLRSKIDRLIEIGI
jgi:hypothetical protein